jgi:TetR/AcrR family transcriptional regulator
VHSKASAKVRKGVSAARAGRPIRAASRKLKASKTAGIIAHKPAIASGRRRGVESSAVRVALIEAADRLIREHGYPAVTARNLADKVNLKRQIVHYYFRSMDDLFIAVIRRGADQVRPRLNAALTSGEPLRTLWEVNSDPHQATLSLELNALASRRPAVRAEVRRFAEEFRDLQTRILVQHLEKRGISPDFQPIVATVLLTSLSQVLTLESAIDIDLGHAQTLQLVDDCLRAFAAGMATPMPRPFPSAK